MCHSTAKQGVLQPQARNPEVWARATPTTTRPPGEERPGRDTTPFHSGDTDRRRTRVVGSECSCLESAYPSYIPHNTKPHVVRIHSLDLRRRSIMRIPQITMILSRFQSRVQYQHNMSVSLLRPVTASYHVMSSHQIRSDQINVKQGRDRDRSKCTSPLTFSHLYISHPTRGNPDQTASTHAYYSLVCGKHGRPTIPALYLSTIVTLAVFASSIG